MDQASKRELSPERVFYEKNKRVAKRPAEHDSPLPATGDVDETAAENGAWSAADRRRARLAAFNRWRAEEKKYNIVTVGTGRKPPPPEKIQPPPAEAESVPLYNFSINSMFEHDVPNMQKPNVRFVKTVVGEPHARPVVPLRTKAVASQGPMSRSCLRLTTKPKCPAEGEDIVELPVSPPIVAPREHVDNSSVRSAAAAAAETTGSNKKRDQDSDRLLFNSLEQATVVGRPKLVSCSRDPKLAPDDSCVISQLKTGEDAVCFFSVNGNATAVKYIYLNRAKTGLEFRPYDLVAVQRGEEEAEHFVISTTGVVHLCPGRQTEVTAIADWMRESALFGALRTIRFFRCYLTYKAFIRWYRNVRLRLYCLTRRRLCQHLFLSKTTFAGPVLSLTKTAHELLETPLLLLSNVGKQDYGLGEFMQLQAQQRTKAQLAFTATVEKMEMTLTKLSDVIQQRANVPNLTSLESLEQYLLANAIVTGTERRGAAKAKSIVQMKQEQHARMCELKRAMVEYQTVNNLIRLVDYVASEAMYKNAVLTLLNFYRNVRDQEHREVKTVGFQLVAAPVDDQIVFSPSMGSIVKLCVDLVDETAAGINSVSRILNQKTLRVYFPKEPRLWSIGSELKKDARMFAVRENITSIIVNDYTLADVKRRQYATTLPWIAFINVQFPETVARWEERNTSTETAATSEEFAAQYALLDQAAVSFRVLISAFIGHLLYINAARMKSELEPKLEAISVEISRHLTIVMRMRQDRLRRYFEEAKTLLATPPLEKELDLPRFVEAIANLNKANAEKAGILDEGIETDSIYALMEARGVELSDEDKQLREQTLGVPNQQPLGNIRPLRDQFFEEILEQAETYKEKKMEIAQQMLQDEVKALNDQCEECEDELLGDTFSEATDLPEEVISQLEDIDKRLKMVHERKGVCTSSAKLLKTAVEWGPLDSAQELFDLRKDVWTLVDTYDRNVGSWFETPLRELDVEKMDHSVKETFQRAFKLCGVMQQRGLQDTACGHLLEELKEMKNHMPVILDCGNKNMTAVHWTRLLAQVADGVYQYNEGLTLGTLRDWGAFEYKDIIAEQSGMATGEANLVKSVDGIQAAWEAIEFESKQYKEDKTMHILATVEDIVQTLDDNSVQLQTIMASRYVSTVKARVEELANDLNTVSAVIEEWITLQKNWMYLEFIFSSDDIKRQLPEESEKFLRVDQLFRDLMGRAVEEKNVLRICTEEGVLEDLKANNHAIDEIQKKLEDYLETKRVAFPRFYFLSNDELLSILSDVRNPRAVQPHLSKCFDSVAALVFGDEDASRITHMRSGEGEEVLFDHVVKPVGQVEQWLSQIEKTMKSSLLQHMTASMAAYPESVREEWFFRFPAQCVQAVDMVAWTGEVEAAIEGRELREFHKDYHAQIIRTVDLVKTALSKLQRSLVCTLIVVDVHNRDVVERLLNAKVALLTDFEWVMQLRYYWESCASLKASSVGIHHCSAHLWYGYEYLGNQPRLVITPLTDRAFLTCTSALAMNLGAAPQGPAGTGKTESVKDLGKALARQVVVFNCSDGINYKTMSRMFAGLAQAGAWACFDEFNRIELEVLSVIAQQMLEIVTALGQNVDHMIFDGHPIRLSKNFGVFITMNPGYAGRTELPDNLKALFRPICMMIPDYALIAEIMFYSEGFSNARVLAQKMVQLYKLSSEQLSKQDHYDFGMRAVKSILVMAGGLKRANPDESEDVLLIRAMRDSNVPKFLREDTVLFMALVRDLFPAVSDNSVPNELLTKYLTADMQENNLQIIDGFILKSMQLLDTLVVRHGVMAVGQTYCAKTSIIKTLQRTLTAIKKDGHDPEGNFPLYNIVHTHILNPKSVTMGELYGEVNAITREWTDGILSNIARAVTREYPAKLDRHWILFDGPVDAIWIENMNTVLDDNKMLCLFSGERIKLPPTAAFLFEVEDLAVASPATVSRCGMVFVEPYYLGGGRGWRPVAQSLAIQFTAENAKVNSERLMELLDMLVSPALDFIRENCSEYIPTVDAQLVVSCIELLKGSMRELDEEWIEPPPPPEPGAPISVQYHDGDDAEIENNVSSYGNFPAVTPSFSHTPVPAAAADSAEEASFSVGGDVPQGAESTENVGGGDSSTSPAAGGGEGNESMGAAGSPLHSPLSPMSPAQELVREFVRPAITHTPVELDVARIFDMYFICAFVWSFGGALYGDSRKRFSEYLLPILRATFPGRIPSWCESVYDIVVHRPSMEYITWSHLVPDFLYDCRIPYFELFVPTPETTATKRIMKTLLTAGRNVLVTGVTGVGKSVIIQDFITATLDADNPESKWEYFYTAFSAQTNSRDVENKVDSKLYKLKSSLLGPTPGKAAIFYIDDLNMPTLEKYGASPPIELIRQLITQGGFYDRKKVPTVFKGVEGLHFVTACGVPGGGRNDVTRRLTSRFHILCQDEVSACSTRRIFLSILAGFLYSFTSEVQSLASKLLLATSICYQKISQEKRPTPDKSHYTFNLRDFSKVIQGLLQAEPSEYKTRDDIVKLFIHEVSRVFHDRLTDDADREWWWETLSHVVESELNTKWDPGYAQLIYGDFMNVGRSAYKNVPDLAAFQSKLLEFQEGFNVEYNKEISLVFFANAAHHMARICRICRQPRGHALLVGVGGSGRQSLSRLAAFICDMPVHQITVTRSYTIQDFRDNLREVLLAGGCGDPVLFLLSDAQIAYEEMLEDINNILNTGEVPNLMQPEDMDRILTSMQPLMQQLGKAETRNGMYTHFVQRCRDGVHIVLAMSPVGDSFRRRLRMFPSLVNCMTIDWFTEWPTDALLAVAAQSFVRIPVEARTRESLCKLCVYIHEEVKTLSQEFFDELRRHNYTTPTSYLELLKSYEAMLAEQSTAVQAQIKRLQGGLDKLQSTEVMVDEMKVTLVKMQPVLEESARSTVQIVTQVETEKGEAAILAADCAKEEEAAMEIKRAADEVRADCQRDLDQALPILQAAEDALNQIEDAAIREMKSFTKPPEKVGKVMEGVLILFGEKQLSWDKSKQLLGRIDFIPSLKGFPKDDITEQTIRKLNKHYVCSPECTADEVRKTSVAAEGIFKWIIAMVKYYEATRIVAPKKAQLAVAEGKLEVAKQAQQAALDKLEAVQQRVAALEHQLQENLDRKKKLEEEMKLTETRLGRAEKLMTGLASEKDRWGKTVKTLMETEITLTGTVAVAAGCVAYLGPFTAPYRERAITCWVQACRDFEIPIAEGEFNLSDIADPVKVREWSQKGLPNDAFSVQNGVIATRSQRWCLCIDPQGQANTWIRNMERQNKLKIIKLCESTYMRTLENAIKVGLPVLMENVEENVDAALDPVLLRQTFKQQGQLLLRLGDSDIEYDPNFKFYMTTKLPNPHYLPELQIKVTIINFTVTPQGLEDQLLAEVVRYERADLEQRADRTVVEIADGKRELKETEDRILNLLATSTGNILDNQVLIETLGEAKKTSETVTRNLEIAETTQQDIATARNRYRAVAVRGALIFGIVREMGGINHMYQISLDFFKRLFVQTLDRTEGSDDVEERVAKLLPAVTLSAYNTVCRGLFERDKQIFAFMLFGNIFRESGELSDLEWCFLLKGTEGRKLVDPDEETWPEWCTEEVWNDLTQLCMLSGFEELKGEVCENSEEWAQWASDDQAADKCTKLFKDTSEWHKLLVLRVFRPDLVTYGMTRTVGKYLGAAFTESPAFDLDAAFADSSPTAPIIFVLTAGTDPTSTFTEFAERSGYGERKFLLSLGQDQDVKAQEMISAASKSGAWVYLQNCHVYASWMPELDRILEELMLRDVHRDFRLWLTTMPTPCFPVLVLQSGIKLVKEPPKGLKANLRDVFLLTVTPELWNSCPQNADGWRRLLFSLSYFHAIIQERRRFGPLGWNIPYEWNQSDFAASIKTLFTYLSDYDDIQWTALRYVIGVINYGGRVTDFLDTRCLQTILSRFFQKEVVTPGVYNITPDGVYAIPADIDNIETAKTYLANLPAFEQTELFGLHANADIAYNRATSKRQLEAILSVQPRSKAGIGQSPDEQVLELVSLFEGRLQPPVDRNHGSEETYRVTEDGTTISLGTVCRQEVDVFNNISNKIRTTLAQLKSAIRGDVVMSAKLEAMYSAFLLGRVPDLWHEGSYLSLKPLVSWFEDTQNRIEFLRDWNDNGMPSSFWISGFFFPQGFLTGVLQTHSRANKIPIDDIKFKTHTTKFDTLDQVDFPPETGVYIHGMFLEGAGFSKATACIQEPNKGELYAPMPVLWLQPVPLSEETQTAFTYACPLYKTSSRAGALSTTGLSTNYVLSLDLKSQEGVSPEHWTLRGAAMLCMLDT